MKKVFVKILQNSQENNTAGVSFSINLQILNFKRCLKFWQKLLGAFFKMPLVAECQNQFWKAPVTVLVENRPNFK